MTPRAVSPVPGLVRPSGCFRAGVHALPGAQRHRPPRPHLLQHPPHPRLPRVAGPPTGHDSLAEGKGAANAAPPPRLMPTCHQGTTSTVSDTDLLGVGTEHLPCCCCCCCCCCLPLLWPCADLRLWLLAVPGGGRQRPVRLAAVPQVAGTRGPEPRPAPGVLLARLGRLLLRRCAVGDHHAAAAVEGQEGPLL